MLLKTRGKISLDTIFSFYLKITRDERKKYLISPLALSDCVSNRIEGSRCLILIIIAIFYQAAPRFTSSPRLRRAGRPLLPYMINL